MDWKDFIHFCSDFYLTNKHSITVILRFDHGRSIRTWYLMDHSMMEATRSYARILFMAHSFVIFTMTTTFFITGQDVSSHNLPW